MKDNPERRAASVLLIITAVAILAIFAPFIFGMDGTKGGFAISFLALVVAMSCIIAAIVFMNRVAALDRLFVDANLSAHWSCSPEDWTATRTHNTGMRKRAKRRYCMSPPPLPSFSGWPSGVIDNGWVNVYCPSAFNVLNPIIHVEIINGINIKSAQDPTVNKKS